MKTILLIIIFCFQNAVQVYAQTQEAQQLILNYEKLMQLREILENMKKGYAILTKGYNTIKDIAEGNFNLHDVFLNGLYAVSPAVRNYKKIPLIIQYQKALVKEQQRAYAKFKNDPNLTVDEIKYLENMYSYIIKQSLRNLDELIMITTASKLRMSDEDRLHGIDRIYQDIERKIIFVKEFNKQIRLLTLNRAKESHDVTTLQKLHDVTP